MSVGLKFTSPNGTSYDLDLDDDGILQTGGVVGKHLRNGINYQAGRATNPGGSGTVTITFAKAFKQVPHIRLTSLVSANVPRAGAVQNVDRFGFTYAFTGTPQEVSGMDFDASEPHL